MAAEKGLGETWIEPFICTEAGVRSHFSPVGVARYQILKETLQALAVTFGKYEVPNVVVAAYSDSHVRATGRVHVLTESVTTF